MTIESPSLASTGDGCIAALDLGSNSFHLLIARIDADKIYYLDRHKEVVRMAAGLDSSDRLSDAIMQKASEALRKFAEFIAGIDKRSVRVVGTNTLRAAKNADEFLVQAEAILGVPIDIISGVEEARLIYLGVTQDLAPGERRRLVVDIGGGSTELIIGEGLVPKQLESLYMGCVSYSGRFFPKHQVAQESYDKAVRAARRELRNHTSLFSSNNWGEAVGSSGTIRAVGSVIDNNWPENHTITLSGIEKLAKRLIKSGDMQTIQLAGLKDERRQVIAGGLAILHAIFLELGLDKMQVSNYSMKEGIIHDLAGRVRQADARDVTVTNMMNNYRVDQAKARQVEKDALVLLEHVKEHVGIDLPQARRLLSWASSLHEIGLSISHNGYQKHGAYICLNADMLGFSKLEQKQISFLILNHRRRLRAVAESYHFSPEWVLVLVFRLACLFNRSRLGNDLPPLSITVAKKTFCLNIAADWLEQYPLTRDDLDAEGQYWVSEDIQFKLVALPADAAIALA